LATKASLLKLFLKSSRGQCRVRPDLIMLCRSDLSNLQRAEPVRRTEVAKSASHMAKATRSHDHVRKPFAALHQLLAPIVSDQHTERVSSHYATCLSHSHKFWRVKGTSCPVTSAEQHIFVLFRSCEHLFCIESACVCTCMSKSLSNILIVCVSHVLGNEMCWAVPPLWSLCYNFLICSEKKGNNTALTN